MIYKIKCLFLLLIFYSNISFSQITAYALIHDVVEEEIKDMRNIYGDGIDSCCIFINIDTNTKSNTIDIYMTPYSISFFEIDSAHIIDNVGSIPLIGEMPSLKKEYKDPLSASPDYFGWKLLKIPMLFDSVYYLWTESTHPAGIVKKINLSL